MEELKKKSLDENNKYAIVDLELKHNINSYGKIQIQIEDIDLDLKKMMKNENTKDRK